MTLRVFAPRPATAREWDVGWEACAGATFVRCQLWAELWSTCSGGTLRPDAQELTLDER
jgi:hypothetical protein